MVLVSWDYRQDGYDATRRGLFYSYFRALKLVGNERNVIVNGSLGGDFEFADRLNKRGELNDQVVEGILLVPVGVSKVLDLQKRGY